MNPITRTILGYLALAAVLAIAISVLTSPARAGNAHGHDGKQDAKAAQAADHPGKAKGHAANGGPATPGAKGANGKLASKLGSLNAAHASPRALARANPRSRVGALAGYMKALVAYEGKHPVYHDLIDRIGATEGEIAAINDTISNIDGKISEIDHEISALSNEVAALDPESETYDADVAALGDQIADLEASKAELESARAAAEADKQSLEADVADLRSELDVVTEELNDAITAAADSLKRAANKDSEIDATVVGAVNSLLDGKSAEFTRNATIQETEEAIASLINSPE